MEPASVRTTRTWAAKCHCNACRCQYVVGRNNRLFAQTQLLHITVKEGRALTGRRLKRDGWRTCVYSSFSTLVLRNEHVRETSEEGSCIVAAGRHSWFLPWPGWSKCLVSFTNMLKALCFELYAGISMLTVSVSLRLTLSRNNNN